MSRRRWPVAAAVAAAATLGLVGVFHPPAALRAVVILCLLTAALVLAEAARRFFERVPVAPASAIRPPESAPTRIADHELPWHYSGLVPSRSALPMLAPGAQAALRTIATERLWERHGLNLWLPSHEPAISDVLSVALWDLVRPHRPTPLPASAFAHSLLRSHLDELDAL